MLPIWTGLKFCRLVETSRHLSWTNVYIIFSLNHLLRYRDPGDLVFISVIFDVLRETTLTISDSIETGSPVESKIVRVISLSTTENNRDNTIKKPIFRVGIP